MTEAHQSPITNIGAMTQEATAVISPVMQQLSAYVASALRKPLPPAVAEKTRHHLLDTLAAMVSGSRLLPGRTAIAYAKALGGAKEACVIGSRCVTTAINAALTQALPSRQGIVEIRLRGGRELRLHTKAVRGTSDNPMTRAEVDTKSYDLMAPVLGKTRARKLCDAVWGIEEISDARRLRPLLQA